MSTQRTFGRLFGAAALGLASLAACAGAASPVGRAPEDQPLAKEPGDRDAVEEAKRVEADKGDAGPRGDASPSQPAQPGQPSDAGGARCPYGELSDPHHGFLRCLTPEERDAGWLPPPPQEPDEPPQATAPDAGKAPPPPPPAIPPLVDVGVPKFENGEVPRVEKALSAAVNDIARCVAEHGGLSAPTGTLKLQFLVRARGRAEGVEVLSAKGIGPEAAACVRLLVKNRSVGAPTSDPVGVTITLSLKPATK